MFFYFYLGFAVEQNFPRRNDGRSSSESVVERRKPIRYSVDVFALFMDRSAVNDRYHVFFMAWIRPVVVTRNSRISSADPGTRFAYNFRLFRTLSNTGRFSGIFFRRLVGQKNVRLSCEDGAEDRRKSAIDERNHIRHTGHQNVHLGETVRIPGANRKEVSTFKVPIPPYSVFNSLPLSVII